MQLISIKKYRVNLIVVHYLLLRERFSLRTLHGWHGSQYVCHDAEVRTGGFCLCLLGYYPYFWVVPALLSAVDKPASCGGNFVLRSMNGSLPTVHPAAYRVCQ